MKGFPATVLLEPILDNSTQGQTNKNMVCLEILSHVMLGLTVQGFPTISSPSTTSGQLYSRGKTKKHGVPPRWAHLPPMQPGSGCGRSVNWGGTIVANDNNFGGFENTGYIPQNGLFTDLTVCKCV